MVVETVFLTNMKGMFFFFILRVCTLGILQKYLPGPLRSSFLLIDNSVILIKRIQ